MRWGTQEEIIEPRKCPRLCIQDLSNFVRKAVHVQIKLCVAEKRKLWGTILWVEFFSLIKNIGARAISQWEKKYALHASTWV